MVRIADIRFGQRGVARGVASIDMGERNEMSRERGVRFGTIGRDQLLNFKPVQDPRTDLCRSRNGNGDSGNGDKEHSNEDVHGRVSKPVAAATPLPWQSWDLSRVSW
jgi:hypothetical protein